jgi:hypothetical protein
VYLFNHIYLDFIACPAFDYTRNILYVANPSADMDGNYAAGLIAFNVNDDCSLTDAWNTALVASTSDNPWPSPVVAGGVVYVATGSFGQVFAIDADTGIIKWKSHENLGFIYASPTIVNGKLLIADCGNKCKGENTQLWAYNKYNRAPPPTASPSAVTENFFVTIGSQIFNLTSIASTGIPDANGQYKQKLYTFSDSTSHKYFLRIPVAGLSTTVGLPAHLDWQYSDFWEVTSDSGYIMLGKYDHTTWLQPSSTTLQVQFTQGSFCPSQGIYRETTIRFRCSTSSTTYIFSEVSTCKCKYFVVIIRVSFMN